MTPSLLRRILLASASGIAACGGRADLDAPEYGSVADAGAGGSSSNAGSSSGGSGGSVSQGGKGGSSLAGAGGSSAGSGGSVAGSGGSSAGSGGAAPVCNNPNPPPKDPSGGFSCPGSQGFGFCELHCYAPGPQTIPGACVAFDDPALVKLPNFQPQGCGFTKPASGPYCDESSEKAGGNSPICCYLGLSQPCAGRPLQIDRDLRLAALVAFAWG